MKNFITPFLVLLLTFVLSEGFGQEYCDTVVKQSNDATTFTVKISMSGDASFGLGTSNIVLSYNNAALSDPILISSPINQTFYNLSVTNQDVTSFNIE